MAEEKGAGPIANPKLQSLRMARDKQRKLILLHGACKRVSLLEHSRGNPQLTTSRRSNAELLFKTSFMGRHPAGR